MTKVLYWFQSFLLVKKRPINTFSTGDTVSKEILIHTQPGERRVAIVNNGKLDDFFIEVEHYQSILGNIYKGRVESILPSINGAFINIGQERNGFLYLTDAVNPLVEEEEVSGPRRFLNKLL